MIRTLLQHVALAAFLGSMPLATAAAAPDDTADIRAAARAFDDAQTHGDRAALERLLAPDFLFVRGSGRVGGRRDFIEGFTAPGVHLDPFAIVDPLFLRIAPDVAIVGGEARVKGSENGRPVARHFRFADMFVRRDGRWVVAYTHVTGLAD